MTIQLPVFVFIFEGDIMATTKDPKYLEPSELAIGSKTISDLAEINQIHDRLNIDGATFPMYPNSYELDFKIEFDIPTDEMWSRFTDSVWVKG